MLFSCSADAPFLKVLLEVEMRFEQIIVTVAHRLAIAEVRVITVIDSFATAMRLHLWLLRTNLGMPSYPGSDSMSCVDVAADCLGGPGCKRGGPGDSRGGCGG